MLSMTAGYLDRLLDAVTEAFTPELAERLINLQADAELVQHVEDLRRKANAGTLTPEEDAEYKEFVEALDVVSILQAKARRIRRSDS